MNIYHFEREKFRRKSSILYHNPKTYIYTDWFNMRCKNMFSAFMLKGINSLKTKFLFHVEILRYVDQYIHLGIFFNENSVYRESHLGAMTLP